MDLLRIAARVASASQPLSDRPDYGSDGGASVPRGGSAPDAPSPYHFKVSRGGETVLVGNFLASSPGEAVVKMNEMFRPPPPEKGFSVEGPFPGEG